MSCQVTGTSVFQRLLKPESGKALAEGQVALQWERTGPAGSDANTGCHGAKDLGSVAQRTNSLSQRNTEGSTKL